MQQNAAELKYFVFRHVENGGERFKKNTQKKTILQRHWIQHLT